MSSRNWVYTSSESTGDNSPNDSERAETFLQGGDIHTEVREVSSRSPGKERGNDMK